MTCEQTFECWFQNKQGESYDTMYEFAKDAWDAAVAAEREACAKVCEERADNAWSIGEAKFAGSVAAAIRARSEGETK